jgi:hypothetical protein
MRDGSIELDFGDGRYKFRLGWAELMKLQEKTDSGPYFLQLRFGRGDWRVQDIEETIRWGLIGGGMTPVEATKMIKLYVYSRPLLEDNGPLATALAVISAALVGAPEEGELGEAGGGEQKAPASQNSQTGNGASPPSSDSQQPPESSSPSS